MDHAEAAIRAFAAPERAPRYLALLGSKRGRAKLRADLAHTFHLDPRFATRVPGTEASPAAIGARLRALGAPESCYCLSEDGELDGRDMPLDQALAATIGRGMGTLISCVPGALAYYEAEDVNERFVLRRAAA